MIHHRFLSSLFVVILIDQLSKHWATKHGIVSLNQGISFGLFNHSQLGLVFILMGVLVAVWYFCKAFWLKHPLFAGLLFGGGVSNIIDRILYSGVRDWLSVPGMNLKNNLADWAIFAAIVSILFLEMVDQREQQEKAKHVGT